MDALLRLVAAMCVCNMVAVHGLAVSPGAPLSSAVERQRVEDTQPFAGSVQTDGERRKKTVEDSPRLIHVREPEESTRDLFCELKRAVGEVPRGMLLAGMDWMALPMTYKTCAVVGSSGVLRRHEHGKAIDAADMVMRFNNAPISGFEDLVGSKTTMRIINEKVLANWVKGEDLNVLDELVTYVSTCAICNVGVSDLVNTSQLLATRETVHNQFPSVDLYVSNLEVEAALDSFFKKVYSMNAKKQSPAGATTGTFGVTLALSICDEVRVYGIAQSATEEEKLPYNYYDEGSSVRKTNIWHRSWTAEKSMWRRFATNGGGSVDREDVAVIPGFSKVKC